MFSGRCIVVACAALMLPGSRAREASFEDKVAALYRPFQAEMVTLAPDGRHVAFTRHNKEQLAVVVVDLDDPTQRTTITVDEDRPIKFSKEKEIARLRYLRWVTPNRLVAVPTEDMVEFPMMEGQPASASRKFITPIIAFDANGQNGKSLAGSVDFAVSMTITPPGAEEPKDAVFSRHINIVGRVADEPECILVEALGQPAPNRNVGPIPTTLFKLNVVTGKITQLADEPDPGRYLYDQQGRFRVLYLQPEHSTTREFNHLPQGKGRWLSPGGAREGSLPKDFTLAADNYFGTRAVPLGFDYDSKTLIFGSNAGRDTWGVYGLNVETRQRTALALEHPYVDLAPLEPEFPSPTLVFDEKRQRLVGVRTTATMPLTVWVDPQLAAIQRALDIKFPKRTVELLEWDDARDVYLLRVTGGNEPGRYFIYKQSVNALTEFLRRAPWLAPSDLHDSTPFDFMTPAGVHLTGYLTFPRAPRLNPPPLLVYLPSGFPARVQPGFDREAQILAGMGFVVARVNHRGAAGFGAKHRDAIHEGVDRVPVADIVATIEWIAGQHKVDRRRVATMGEGFGGYLALRALQLNPTMFRCAIALNAPLDLALWLRQPLPDNIEDDQTVDFAQEAQRAFFMRNATKLEDTSVLKQAEALTKPVFLIVDPVTNREIGIENSRLRSQLRKLGRTTEYLELKSDDFALGSPAARARVFKQIEEFFNLNLYDYKVQIGEVEEKK